MMMIFGLMLLLLQTAACVEQICSIHRSDQICYAALGHKLNLLMVDAREYDLVIQKRINNPQDDPVCRVKYGRLREKQCELFNNSSGVTFTNETNGILMIINPVVAADSGNYTLQFTFSNSSITSTNLQVNVEAPIGSVEVSIICSSSGVRRASCSSEGDQLLYSWTLNGDPLMDGDTSIQLKEGTDGNITCRVKNNVSHGQKTVSVTPCPGTKTATVTSSLTSTVTSNTQTSNCVSVTFVLVWSFQMMVLFGVLGGFHIYMRHRSTHTSGKKQEDQNLRMRRFREEEQISEK